MQANYYLRLLDEFTCLGADCPDDCCHDWNLHIDAQTLNQWKNIENQSIRSELLDSISILNEHGKAVEVVQHGDDGRCQHLSEQGLCKIQLHCGHDLLPETCREYPRVTIENSNTHTKVKSAHLSCPGIIRLLSTQTPDTTLFKKDTPDNRERHSLDSESTEISDLLEYTVSQLMAETHYRLSHRLFLISTLLDQLSTVLKQGGDEKKHHKICRSTAKGLHKLFTDCQKKLAQSKFKLNKKTSGMYWQLVFKTCRVFDDAVFKTQLVCSPTFTHMNELNLAVNITSDQVNLKSYHLIRKLYHRIPDKVIRKIDALLMPYMLVKFKNHGFPWYLYKNNLILTLLDCVIPLYQINMLLWYLYESGHEISKNDIITAIYKVEKKSAHNTLILEQLEIRPELLNTGHYAAAWLGA